jgi:hypothetical protein
MVFDEDGPKAVAIEFRNKSGFDDVVEFYGDRNVWLQIKWAANPTSELYTIDSISKPPSRNAQSLICSLAKGWKELADENKPFAVRLYSNRYPDPELCEILEGDPPKLKANLTSIQKSRIGTAWLSSSGLDEAEFEDFLKKIEFHLARKSSADLAQEIRIRLRQAHAPRASFEQLMLEIQSWSTDHSKDFITKADVEAVLGSVGDVPDNNFQLDAQTLVSRQSVHSSLATLVRNSAGKYVVILGAPGSGKSTALNTIGPKSALARNDKLIVYNCFTGPGDAFLRTRASARNFVNFLVSEMFRLFPGKWKRRRGDSSELELILNEAAKAVEPQQRLIIIVDGLDYARANITESEVGLINTLPRNLPGQLTIVVSAQSREQLPEHLQNLASAQYLGLPALTIDQSNELLAKAGVYEAWSLTNEYYKKKLVRAVFNKTSGHPLCTKYLAKWLLDHPGDKESLSETLSELPSYADSIHDWYAQLPSFGGTYPRALLAEMSACPFPLTPFEANKLVLHPRDAYEAEDALKQLSFLLRRCDNVYQFTHDSLREWAQGITSNPTKTSSTYFELLNSLNGDARKGEHILDVAIQASQQTWAFDTVNADWITDRFLEGARPSLVQDGLRHLLRDAISRRNWPHAAKWALLHERIERYFSQQIELTTVRSIWLFLRRQQLSLRQVVDGDTLIVSPTYAFEFANELSRCGYESEASRITNIAIGTPLDLPDNMLGTDWKRLVVPYVESLSVNAAVEDCIEQIEHILRTQSSERKPNDVEEPDKLKNRLMTASAIACYRADQFDKVQIWCDKAKKHISGQVKTILLAAIATRPPASVAKDKTIAIALDNKPPLRLIQSASLNPRYKKKAISALERREPPRSLLDDRFLMSDNDDTLAAVHDLYQDVRLCLRLGLTERLVPFPVHEFRFFGSYRVSPCIDRAWRGTKVPHSKRLPHFV